MQSCSTAEKLQQCCWIPEPRVYSNVDFAIYSRLLTIFMGFLSPPIFFSFFMKLKGSKSTPYSENSLKLTKTHQNSGFPRIEDIALQILFRPQGFQKYSYISLELCSFLTQRILKSASTQLYSQISLKTFMGQKVHHGGTVIDALFQPLIDGFSQGCVVLGPRLQEN